MVVVIKQQVSHLQQYRTAFKEEFQDIDWLKDFPCNVSCTSLQLVQLSLANLNHGKIFQSFQNLSELYFQGRFDLKPPLFLDIQYLPRTIKRLVLSELTIGTESVTNDGNCEIWRLEYLWFDACEFAPNFLDRFHETFDCKHLTISQDATIDSFTNQKLLLPGIQFVCKLTKSPNWKSLRTDFFNWSVTDDEHSIDSFISEMRKCLEDSAKLHNVPLYHPSILISRDSSNPSKLIMKKLTRVIIFSTNVFLILFSDHH